jgi:glucose-1-phosphate cytidylyltransferase
LSDIPLDEMIADFEAKNVVASLAGVTAGHSFHTVDAGADGLATRIGAMANGDLLLNGGFFVLRQEIFDYIEPGDELVDRPFKRLTEKRLLAVYQHSGFWRAMDTLKDKITFDRMEAQGHCPWMVWKP